MVSNEPEVIIVTSEEHVEHANTSVITPEIRARRPRKVSGGMFGPLEIGAVALSAVALGAVILLYIFFVVPSNNTLARNRADADRLDAELISAKTKYGEITSTETQVAKLLTSVDDFETRFLPPATNGRSTIYQRINGLIVAYGLTNTTGPDYMPLETGEKNTGDETASEKGRAKFRSLFPGIYISMTVEGPYQNLRRFIRDIETGNEFVVISTIELEPSDSEQKKRETGAPPAGQPGGNPTDPASIVSGIPSGQVQPDASKPKGKTRGEIVALHLEMAAYFRRANYAPMVEKGTAQ